MSICFKKFDLSRCAMVKSALKTKYLPTPIASVGVCEKEELEQSPKGKSITTICFNGRVESPFSIIFYGEADVTLYKFK